MSSIRPKLPTYRCHKGSGQAFVQIKGVRHYLGKWGTKESQERYRRAIAELTRPEPAAAPLESRRPGDAITVVELAAAYLHFAAGYYVKDGKPTGSMDRVKAALRILRSLYGSIPVDEFGPLKLEAIQAELVKQGKSRRYVNHLAQAMRRVFRWGVAKEMVPASIPEALNAVAGLKKGRTEAREPGKVLPVADSTVQTTLPHLPEIVADMVLLQRLTGARPAEICILRPIDVDRSGDVWIYRPAAHKTDWHEGRERVILIGPRGQDVLRKYLVRPTEAYCFSPKESLEQTITERRANRKSKITPSQAARRRKARPDRAPADHYTTHTYRQAITRAVDRANREAAKQGIATIPHWAPNQLRHTAGTEVSDRFGAEAAQTVLGHAHLRTTEIYAERNIRAAAEIMRQIG